MLCYSFPPLGGGGTPRSVKFVKYLGGCGYRPLVITTEHSTSAFGREFQADPSLERDLQVAQFDRVNVDSPLAERLAQWQRSRWYRWLWVTAYPWVREAQRPWSLSAARWLLRLPRSEQPALIYASAAPTSALEAASLAASKLAIPWIADLRDLWTEDTVAFYPTRWHYLWERALERRVLGSAAAIITNTRLAGKAMRAWLGPDLGRRVCTLPNGYDPDDFAPSGRSTGPTGVTVSGRRDQQCTLTLVHAGTLHPPEVLESRLGRYRPHALDNTARSLGPLLRGLEALDHRAPSKAARLRFHLVGYVPESARRQVEQSRLAAQFRFDGCLPRRSALDVVRGADGQLALQLAWEDPTRPMTKIPGKIYDSLATGQPIFAPLGAGDLKDLLAQAPQAYVCDYRQPAEIAATLGKMIDDLDTGRVGRADRGWLDQYNRRRLTRQLADLFDRVLEEAGRAVPRVDVTPDALSTETSPHAEGALR